MGQINLDHCSVLFGQNLECTVYSVQLLNLFFFLQAKCQPECLKSLEIKEVLDLLKIFRTLDISHIESSDKTFIIHHSKEKDDKFRFSLLASKLRNSSGCPCPVSFSVSLKCRGRET